MLWAIRADADELDSAIERLRQLRVDIRTSRTHPTLGPEQVICTYPFPLLSEKAHVSRNVKTLVANAERVAVSDA